jgi:ribonuclease Z
MPISVTVLGSASALPTSNRFLTAHVLNADERFFLIDCGEGTQFQLRKYKAKLGRLNHIFITHLHGDHMFGLPGLISTLNLLGRTEDLHIYAPAELKTILQQFLYHFFDYFKFRIVYHPLNPEGLNLIYEDKSLTVQSFPLKHRIETHGFLFKEKTRLLNIKKDVIECYKIPVKEIFNIKNGADFITEDGAVIPNKRLTTESHPPKSYAFCSDTAYTESFIEYIQNVDLLYHEATFSDEDLARAKDTFHSTASQAATIAEKANAKQLLIGHFSARYDNESVLKEQAQRIFKNTLAAKEGLTINL